jgi:hypothetical protein
VNEQRRPRQRYGSAVKHILERDRDARSKAHDVQLPAAARARQSRRCQKRIVVVLPSCAERYLSTAFFEKFATIENHPRSLPVIVPHMIANALAQTPMALIALGSAATSDERRMRRNVGYDYDTRNPGNLDLPRGNRC